MKNKSNKLSLYGKMTNPKGYQNGGTWVWEGGKLVQKPAISPSPFGAGTNLSNVNSSTISPDAASAIGVAGGALINAIPDKKNKYAATKAVASTGLSITAATGFNPYVAIGAGAATLITAAGETIAASNKAKKDKEELEAAGLAEQSRVKESIYTQPGGFMPGVAQGTFGGSAAKGGKISLYDMAFNNSNNYSPHTFDANYESTTDGTGYKHGGNKSMAKYHNLSKKEYDKKKGYQSGGLHYNDTDAFNSIIGEAHDDMFYDEGTSYSKYSPLNKQYLSKQFYEDIQNTPNIGSGQSKHLLGKGFSPSFINNLPINPFTSRDKGGYGYQSGGPFGKTGGVGSTTGDKNTISVADGSYIIPAVNAHKLEDVMPEVANADFPMRGGGIGKGKIKISPEEIVLNPQQSAMLDEIEGGEANKEAKYSPNSLYNNMYERSFQKGGKTLTEEERLERDQKRFLGATAGIGAATTIWNIAQRYPGIPKPEEFRPDIYEKDFGKMRADIDQDITQAAGTARYHARGLGGGQLALANAGIHASDLANRVKSEAVIGNLEEEDRVRVAGERNVAKGINIAARNEWGRADATAKLAFRQAKATAITGTLSSMMDATGDYLDRRSMFAMSKDGSVSPDFENRFNNMSTKFYSAPRAVGNEFLMWKGTKIDNLRQVPEKDREAFLTMYGG